MSKLVLASPKCCVMNLNCCLTNVPSTDCYFFKWISTERCVQDMSISFHCLGSNNEDVIMVQILPRASWFSFLLAARPMQSLGKFPLQPLWLRSRSSCFPTGVDSSGNRFVVVPLPVAGQSPHLSFSFWIVLGVVVEVPPCWGGFAQAYISLHNFLSVCNTALQMLFENIPFRCRRPLERRSNVVQ